MNKNPDPERLSNKFTLELNDYFLTGEKFRLKENEDFGFLETNPQPLENLNDYYESENYISHTDSEKTLMDRMYKFVKNHNLSYKFSKLLDTVPGNKILDYGCGTGDFLVYAKGKKLEVFGVEPNPKALNISREKLGFEFITDKPIDELNQKFDIITMWHVMEHIPNLFEFLEELKSKLNPGGKIYIAVPNHLSFDAKFYKNYWAAYDVPRHLWHFSPNSMQKLFNSFGMKIEKQYPLWFDSYYVSLLSEKYKKNSLGFLRAIIIGTLSNLAGILSGNYSSVIYQISKNEN